MTPTLRQAAQALVDCYDDPKLADQFRPRLEALTAALAAPEPDLRVLLDIAAAHFSEGMYGLPDPNTSDAILAHWRAGRATGAEIEGVDSSWLDEPAGDTAVPVVAFSGGNPTLPCVLQSDHIAAIAERDARIKGLKNVLTEAAQTFRQYEDIHRAKGTDDGLLKARRNADIADRCDAAIAAGKEKA